MDSPLHGLRCHPLILVLLFAALFVRALVPDGFMPAKGELVELCTLHGPKVMVVDPLTGELVEVQNERSAPPCPFSLILSALGTPSLPPAQARMEAQRTPDIGIHTAPGTRPSLALPCARAPPRA